MTTNPYLEEKAFTELVRDDSELAPDAAATPDLYVPGQLPRYAPVLVYSIFFFCMYGDGNKKNRTPIISLY